MSGADVLAPSSTSPPNPSHPGRRSLSVHRALGGGAVADVLLWRRRSLAAIVAAGATATWFLFERSGFGLLSLIANTFLLLVAVLFLWARSASLFNRPLPPIPNLEVSDEAVGSAAAAAGVWINRVLSVGHEIAIARDRKAFLEVVMVLWMVSYIGSFFDCLTLVYIVVLLTLTLPALYDKYQYCVDEKLGVVCGLVSKRYACLIGKAVKQPAKEKKIQ